MMIINVERVRKKKGYRGTEENKGRYCPQGRSTSETSFTANIDGCWRASVPVYIRFKLTPRVSLKEEEKIVPRERRNEGMENVVPRFGMKQI